MADISTITKAHGQPMKLRDMGDSTYAEVVSVSQPRATVNATIANGTSESGTVDLFGTSILGFIAPAAWTAAALNIETSVDGTNWVTAGLFDSAGAAVSSWSSITAGAGYSVDPVAMLAWRYIRLRSGTTGTPVNQGADRVFTIVTRPLS